MDPLRVMLIVSILDLILFGISSKLHRNNTRTEIYLQIMPLLTYLRYENTGTTTAGNATNGNRKDFV